MPILAAWLVGWTIGVLIIQHMVIAEPLSAVALFAVTHGGAEVVVLALASKQLADGAAEPGEPTVDLDHDGLRATWRRGSGTPLGFVVGSAFFAVLIGALVLGALASASTAGALGWVAALAFLVAWVASGVNVARRLGEHRRTHGTVALTAGFEELLLSDRGTDHRMALHGLRVEARDDRLILGDVEVPCKRGGALTSLVDTLTLMADRAEMPEPVVEPAALARLRAGETG